MAAATIFTQQPLLAQVTETLSEEQTEYKTPQKEAPFDGENWWTFGLVEQANLDRLLSESVEAELTERTSKSVSAIEELRDWSVIIYQSMRDGNWEIYTAQGDGSNPVRTTDHPASDIYPRLNHGADRILFASNRSGNYDIYTMNRDGTDIVALAAHGATDTMPTWSRDGSRIAFVSDRNGEQPDIYVMNGDGSDIYQIRLDDTIDVMPRMSPDGQKIAWIRIDNDGNHQLWIMNDLGVEQRQLTGNQLIQNILWSPDSKQLVISANNAADIWYDLYLVDINSGVMTDFRLAPPKHDYYLGGWSSDGSNIFLSDLTYTAQGNRWVLTDFELRRLRSDGYYLRNMDNDTFALASDWRSADITPPLVHMEPLPQYSYYRDYPRVSLWTSDDGPAELWNYDIQIKMTPSHEWQDWRMGTSYIPRYDDGAPGQTVAFRARARDRAGNVGDWAEEVSTTFYNEQFVGYVRDVHGIPLRNALVDIEPALFSPLTDANGRYEALLTDFLITKLDVSHPGYETISLPRDSYLGSGRDFYLPDAINLIENGNFDNAEDPLMGWTHSGAGIHPEETLRRQEAIALNLNRTISHSYLRQSITIPETMHKPQLSFWYEASFGNVVFDVTVDNGIESASVFATSQGSRNPLFKHINMEHWAGETVTVTFQYSRTAEEYYTKWVLLDEIALGPWRTPIFGQISVGDQVPGASSTLLINGENFVETPAVYIGETEVAQVRKIDDSNLEIEMPETLNPGIYHITIVGPSGHSGTSSAVIQVGQQFYLPLIIE